MANCSALPSLTRRVLINVRHQTVIEERRPRKAVPTIEKEFDYIMRQLSRKSALVLSALSAVPAATLLQSADAAPPERPTFNHTADSAPQHPTGLDL